MEIINIKNTKEFNININNTNYLIDIYYLINNDNYASDYDVYINKCYGNSIISTYLLYTLDNIYNLEFNISIYDNYNIKINKWLVKYILNSKL
jgi:hypothetical protein